LCDDVLRDVNLRYYVRWTAIDTALEGGRPFQAGIILRTYACMPCMHEQKLRIAARYVPISMCRRDCVMKNGIELGTRSELASSYVTEWTPCVAVITHNSTVKPHGMHAQAYARAHVSRSTLARTPLAAIVNLSPHHQRINASKHQLTQFQALPHQPSHPSTQILSQPPLLTSLSNRRATVLHTLLPALPTINQHSRTSLS
jgi:hypothetical protein